jgi:hypothetical protein
MRINYTRLLRVQFLQSVTMTASMFWHITPYSMEEVSEESNFSIFRAPNINCSMFSINRLLTCMQPTHLVRSWLWIGKLRNREVTTERAGSNRVKRYTAEMTSVARLAFRFIAPPISLVWSIERDNAVLHWTAQDMNISYNVKKD